MLIKSRFKTVIKVNIRMCDRFIFVFMFIYVYMHTYMCVLKKV